MTDREMLEFCLKAFEAVPAAYTAKAFMKQWTFPQYPYEGPATYKLARKMQRVLREHLGVQND